MGAINGILMGVYAVVLFESGRFTQVLLYLIFFQATEGKCKRCKKTDSHKASSHKETNSQIRY